MSKKIFDLNIDRVYIDNILNGFKTHEYRLANLKRKEVKIGDYLNLKSKDNSYNLLVEVTNISIYKNWYDALINFWENDFKGIYNSLDETINNCLKFYSKEDVKKYGIIVYSIKKAS